MVWFTLNFPTKIQIETSVPYVPHPLPPKQWMHQNDIIQRKTVWRLSKRNPFVIYNPKWQNVISTRTCTPYTVHVCPIQQNYQNNQYAHRNALHPAYCLLWMPLMYSNKKKVFSLMIQSKIKVNYTNNESTIPYRSSAAIHLCYGNGLQWFPMTPHTHTHTHTGQKIITNNGLNA